MKRVTLKDIAKVAGVSHTTVSLALRNSRSIPEATRTRIKDIGLRMGYRPDPALASLNLYRLAKRPAQYHATLAWINPHPNRHMVRSIEEFDRYFQGASRRAEELGYKVEEFWIHEPGMTSARLTEIFMSRGIQGLLLAPACSAKFDLDLPWEQFSTITFEFSHNPRFHLVISTQYRNMRLAYRKLCERGYQRIGCHMTHEFCRRTDYNFLSGYLTESRVQGRKPLLHLDHEGGEFSMDKYFSLFKEWVAREKPDAVIVFAWWGVYTALKELGLRVSEDIAVASLTQSLRHPMVTGVDENPEQIGQIAAEQLINLIQRNELGWPTAPLEILVSGQWIEGASAPVRQ